MAFHFRFVKVSDDEVGLFVVGTRTQIGKMARETRLHIFDMNNNKIGTFTKDWYELLKMDKHATGTYLPDAPYGEKIQFPTTLVAKPSFQIDVPW
jgi:hypothetical protein